MSGGPAEFVKAHPYFFANLPSLAFSALALRLARNRDYALATLIAGLGCLPNSLLALTFGAYWRPARLGGLPFGIEDLSFSYAAGTIAWLAATFPNRDAVRLGAVSLPQAALRMLCWELAAAAANVLLWLAGLDAMTAGLVSGAGLLLFLLYRQASRWKLAVAGLATFTPLYVLLMGLGLALWPNLGGYWNPAGPWSPRVLGVPRGEIAWPAVFGAMWPVLVASALDVKFVRSRAQDSSGVSP